EAQRDVIAISAGSYFSMALKADGSVVVWGYNEHGQCNVPEEARSGVIAISAGGFHCLALKADGSVVAWGDNSIYYKQCNVPAAAKNGIVSIYADCYHSVALKNNGSVVAWGNNEYGQCTVPAEARSGVIAIGAGNRHSMAIKAEGKVIVWGNNEHGQCTVPVEARSGVIAVISGCYHNLALKRDGSLVAWGLNNKGQCNVPELNLLGRLSNLIISAGTFSPGFNPNTLNYSVNIENMGSIALVAILENPRHILKINGEEHASGVSKTITLTEGVNKIRIDVDSGSLICTYTINVNVVNTIPVLPYILVEWHMDEGKHTTVNDSSGLEKHGTLNGAAWVRGIKGYGLRFYADGNKVSINKKSLNQLANWSFEVWIKPEGSGYLYTEGNPWETLILGITDDNQLRISTCHNGRPGKWSHYYSPENIIKRNEWNHLVVTLENGDVGVNSGVVCCYVNGRLVDTGRLGSFSNEYTNNAVIGGNIGYEVGQLPFTFKGIMDQMTLYSIVLTPEDILQRYNQMLFVQDIKLTTIDNKELMTCMLQDSFLCKLSFELYKTIDTLELEFEMPSNIIMESIMNIMKDGVKSDFINATIEENKLIITQEGQALEPGKYEMQISMFNGHVFSVNTKGHDSEPLLVEIVESPNIL
ncbi:MAG: LamG-like jellyroll fold domain-containing protein, partial [Peptococcia bacterium]